MGWKNEYAFKRYQIQRRLDGDSGCDGAKTPTFSKELIYNSSAMASGGSDFWQIDGAPK